MAAFWDRVAGLYDLAESLNRSANEAVARAAAALIPPGAAVPECAAGTGALSLAAARRAGQVLCTDMSLPMLAQAQKKAWRQGLSNIRFAQRDLMSLPPSDGRFDVVIAANVLHLLPDPRQALYSLQSAVKPGGRLIVPTFLQGETRPAFRPVIEAYKLLGFRFCHAFTLESYQSLLAACCPPGARAARLPGRVPVGLGVAEL